MKKYLLGPALAALATFMLGFIYWGLPPHLAYKSLGTVPDVSATAIAVGKMFPASGVYLLPSPLDGDEKMNELAARGPSIEVHVTKEGLTGAAMAKGMALGFVHMFVVSLLLTIILSGLAKAFECWSCRVRFCASIGLLVATCDLGSAIWWHHALGWTLAQSVYDFLMYLVIGLVLATFVTPKGAAPVAAA